MRANRERSPSVRSGPETPGKTRQPAAQKHASLSPELTLHRTLGNQVYGQFVQARLAVSSPDDPYEREADRVADRVTGMPAPLLRHTDPGGLPENRIPRASDTRYAEPETTPAPENGIGDLPGGRPLPAPERSFFESRFGYDFGKVRVHTGTEAAASAEAINARAYTSGNRIVFNTGQYVPNTSGGQHLIAHELAHVVQQATSRSMPSAVYRQPEETRPPETPTLPPFTLTGTGLTILPGPLSPTLLGQRLPLPASLRLTNALGVGPGPSFVFDVAPELLVLNFLDSIDLRTWTRPGTPPNAPPGPENQARISLINPRITFEPQERRLRGNAILSVGSDYPPAFRGPTNIDVTFESTELGQFTGRLGYGPLHADFSLRLHYDTDRLERSIAPVFAPQGGLTGLWSRFQAVLTTTVPGIRLDTAAGALQSLLSSLQAGQVRTAEFVTRTIDLIRDSIPSGAGTQDLQRALSQFAEEITHPGFSLSGRLGLSLPFQGTLPLTRFSAEAPTTVPLERPLLGAPTAFPLSFTAGGIIVAPPGSLSETAVPALGFTHSAFGERTGFSATGALLPTLSPAAISAGEPFVRQFPVYAYAEVSHVRRISEDLDLGLRLTIQVSTPELFGPRQQEGGDSAEQFNRLLQQYREAEGRTGPPVVPNIGLTAFGRFNLF